MKEMIARVGDAITQSGIASVCLTGEELVRCKDCKHLEHLKYLDEINEKECYVCRKHTFTGMRSPDWFCADGERR